MNDRPVCLDELEDIARNVLPKNVFEIIRSGAGDEETLTANRKAFAK